MAKITDGRYGKCEQLTECQMPFDMERMNTKPICPSCRKNHYGQCRVGQDGCYRCGTLGHIAKFCPKLKQPKTGKESVMASDQETSFTIEIPGCYCSASSALQFASVLILSFDLERGSWIIPEGIM
ncbi:hypothetical protein F511_37252 [Dorcoceras hygrometricum]|uniref:CCHC-type domain-containing protein n=1 Tax=Dorcoceras hygrometricum TaxID=472368 RepID=A0A2Z7B7Y6_9LAMI|nr:hypothetical protein F511_37252 [Dorcoceras hygrometricum]